ncbi:MAG: dihydropteroate synthase [Actinobacteria bacterium]|nr:dihydropteroate synthase [Actinomycetota bacterium]
MLRHATGALDLDSCVVMGIVNRTPDSFYDGGRMDTDDVIERALRLVDDGAAILDLGAVKAGPGEDVGEQEEIDRLLPLVEALAKDAPVPLSVETARPSVAKLAFGAGAAMVNDVSALADPDLARVCAEAGGALVLMHNGEQVRGRPRNPRYDDVVVAVIDEWKRLESIATKAGVGPDQIVVDAGLDFGKTTFHSLEIMRRLEEQVAYGRPLLLAPSRKDVVGESLGLGVAERLEGTLALVALGVLGGVSIVRVHDVAPALRVVRMVETVMGVRRPEAPIRGLWE